MFFKVLQYLNQLPIQSIWCKFGKNFKSFNFFFTLLVEDWDQILISVSAFTYPNIPGLFAVDDKPLEVDACNPSPCGPNADCRDGICTCLLEYQGDPYVGCRPECILNSECPHTLACIRNKCKDPCPGTCGQNALCSVINHIPICSCPPGMSGNPFVQCSIQQG